MFIRGVWEYPQLNSHHSLTLGEHCKKTYQYLLDHGITDMNLLEAAKLHDCGKPLTQMVDDEGIAHYYNHQNVGAYEALTYHYPDGCDPLLISILIDLHMFPMYWERNPQETDGMKRKYKKIWGEELFHKVMLLHEADVHAQ